MSLLYFAYGSNLNLRQMAGRCPDAEPMGPALLRGHRLVFRGVADVEPARASIVHGGLWSITDECLEALDRYEGYPRLYDRERVAVEHQGQTVKALVYRMTERHQGRYDAPSVHYLGTIAQGFTDFGLERKHLGAALRRTGELMRRAGLER